MLPPLTVHILCARHEHWLTQKAFRNIAANYPVIYFLFPSSRQAAVDRWGRGVVTGGGDGGEVRSGQLHQARL